MLLYANGDGSEKTVSSNRREISEAVVYKNVATLPMKYTNKTTWIPTKVSEHWL